jgi:hypothetical protein
MSQCVSPSPIAGGKCIFAPRNLLRERSPKGKANGDAKMLCIPSLLEGIRSGGTRGGFTATGEGRLVGEVNAGRACDPPALEEGGAEE